MSKQAQRIVSRLLEDEREFGTNPGVPQDLQQGEDEYPEPSLEDTWNEDKNGEYIQINDDGSVVYVAHGSVMETIPVDLDDQFAGIRAWMEAKQFYPNIWQTNDHGNVTLFDSQGNDLGGLV